MNLATPYLPAHPLDDARLDGARRRAIETGAGPEAAAWNAVSACIVALTVIVLRHVNPGATAPQALSYIRHSTLRDLLDEASILEPDLTTRVMRDALSQLAGKAVPDAVRRGRSGTGPGPHAVCPRV